ncbi:hypothetical protein SGP15_11025 [Brenneria sp. L4-2C]|uniref:hypothetical protein n=1 Tax=Brenneria sp. L4-2C TaxID=3094863 RepID=UPI0029C4F3CE|nr:hypothetical protein [Brenneria sp. L4-2C]MDX5695648.1 hypothetical protein [Brenneria sp. L4-2C]
MLDDKYKNQRAGAANQPGADLSAACGDRMKTGLCDEPGTDVNAPATCKIAGIKRFGWNFMRDIGSNVELALG